ncbi:hypothetical protein HYG77_37760 (plasmid) [Rhodococcus sp. ZPP]|uniref:hypothetical protein n=1 Tax=Rhodococcus TaxID=1827 RepID=UPI0006BB51F2|nr:MULTISPECIES: hypothetical protein [Rhodococcus]QHE73646.1 hypothetical protein GFS60_07309 [Rhodococcus sp. WAY2]QTJ71186.1 hypothetical protein HYG77_37760 [Rhodococcus sp. ZPP]
MPERSAATEGQVVDLAAARAARTRALLSGTRPVSDVLARAGSPGVRNLRVDQLIATYLPGAALGPAAIMAVLGIAEDSLVGDLTAEQRRKVQQGIEIQLTHGW